MGAVQPPVICCCESEDQPEASYPVTCASDGYAELPIETLVSCYASPGPEAVQPQGRDRSVSWAIELNQNPDDASPSTASRKARTISGFSGGSAWSTGTARPGEAVQMSFDLIPGEYVYDEGQFRRIASVQPDGSVAVTGIFVPFAVTIDGHPAILPGDTILEVVGSDYNSPGSVLRRLEWALQRGGKLTLLVATRPQNFDVDLFCEGEYWFKLGILATIERTRADCIKVQAVYEQGLMSEWNLENPKCQVVPGDWITHVNGETKTAQEMTRDIHDCSRGENVWLGIQTQSRRMGLAIGGVEAKNKPRKDEKQPHARERVPTVDWREMQQDLRRR